MHVRVARSQNELVKNFQISYFNDHNNLKLQTLQSVKVEITLRLGAPLGTMCTVHTILEAQQRRVRKSQSQLTIHSTVLG